jgi:hypothetical protein
LKTDSGQTHPTTSTFHRENSNSFDRNEAFKCSERKQAGEKVNSASKHTPFLEPKPSALSDSLNHTEENLKETIPKEVVEIIDDSPQMLSEKQRTPKKTSFNHEKDGNDPSI